MSLDGDVAVIIYMALLNHLKIFLNSLVTEQEGGE